MLRCGKETRGEIARIKNIFGVAVGAFGQVTTPPPPPSPLTAALLRSSRCSGKDRDTHFLCPGVPFPRGPGGAAPLGRESSGPTLFRPPLALTWTSCRARGWGG